MSIQRMIKVGIATIMIILVISSVLTNFIVVEVVNKNRDNTLTANSMNENLDKFSSIGERFNLLIDQWLVLKSLISHLEITSLHIKAEIIEYVLEDRANEKKLETLLSKQTEQYNALSAKISSTELRSKSEEIKGIISVFEDIFLEMKETVSPSQLSEMSIDAKNTSSELIDINKKVKEYIENKIQAISADIYKSNNKVIKSYLKNKKATHGLESLLNNVLRNTMTTTVITVLTLILIAYLLIRKINRMSFDLTSISDDLTEVSVDITDGNLELAQRTKDQANSLKNTVSTMGIITTMLKQTTENSRSANALTNKTTEVMAQGKEMSESILEAMNAIDNSSNKISKIVKLVNEVAFQTNILAINAAIEAAKAGDAGKGFAVVALEVRDLAQRSAKAAKDIKLLIEDSINKVNSGNNLVTNNDEILTDMNGKVNQVSKIMLEIFSANEDQYSAIDQINSEVSQLDISNNQNSVLVENISTSSKIMSDSSLKMKNLLKAFLAR